MRYGRSMNVLRTFQAAGLRVSHRSISLARRRLTFTNLFVDAIVEKVVRPRQVLGGRYPYQGMASTVPSFFWLCFLRIFPHTADIYAVPRLSCRNPTHLTFCFMRTVATAALYRLHTLHRMNENTAYWLSGTTVVGLLVHPLDLV